MVPQGLAKLLQSVLNSDANTAEAEDEFLDKLRFFFDDSVLLAALDIVDRDNVIRYTTAWGHFQYQVQGSTDSYAVFPNSTNTEGLTMAYCTCPAFAYSVLLSDAQYMCKHLLATFLAQRMARCIDRSVGQNDLASILARPASSA